MPELLDHLPIVEDFPRPGVRFRDIGPLLADPAAFGAAIDGLAVLAREARCALLVDDVIATGGTLLAGARLVRAAGGEVAGAIALLEIAFLEGCAAMAAAGLPARTLLRA